MDAKFRQWYEALRIPFLVNTVAPVCIATAMAFGDGISHWPTALILLFGIIAAHIGFACIHAYGDVQKKVEYTEYLNFTSLKVVSAISFIGAAVVGILIFRRVGWPIIVLGAIALILCALYARTRYTHRLCGLSDAIALIVLGPLAVAITYYAQSFEINAAVIIAGCAPGMFSASLIAINNICDVSSDRERGKSTVAVCFGVPFAIREYFFLVTGASLIPLALYLYADDYIYTILAVTTLFFTFPALRSVICAANAQQLKTASKLTVRLLVIYSVLFSAGWVLSVRY